MKYKIASIPFLIIGSVLIFLPLIQFLNYFLLFGLDSGVLIIICLSLLLIYPGAYFIETGIHGFKNKDKKEKRIKLKQALGVIIGWGGSNFIMSLNFSGLVIGIILIVLGFCLILKRI